MRLSRSAVPAVLPVVLLLGACSSGDDAEGGGGLDAVTVADAAEGEQPEVEVETPLSVEETAADVRTEGDGEVIEVGDFVTVRFVGVNARTGEPFGATGWGEDGEAASFVLGESVIPGFTTALEGVAEGSRVVTAVAPDDAYGPQGGLPDAGIEADDTLVYLIDVLDVGAARAEGEAVTPPEGLPAVTLEEATGAPTIVMPAGEPPAELVVQPLIVGDGEVVESGDTITVHYTGAIWGSGTVFDSSWENGSPVGFPIGVGSVIPGWDAGLVGQTVGSQVLLVIPPAQGYGETGQPSAGIAGTDTLVFVVDILAAS